MTCQQTHPGMGSCPGLDAWNVRPENHAAQPPWKQVELGIGGQSISAMK